MQEGWNTTNQRLTIDDYPDDLDFVELWKSKILVLFFVAVNNSSRCLLLVELFFQSVDVLVLKKPIG